MFHEEGDCAGKLLEKWEDIPVNPSNSIPVNTAISGSYIPTLSVTESGWALNLRPEVPGSGDVFSNNIHPAQDPKG